MAGQRGLRSKSTLTRMWHGLRDATRRYFVAGLLAFAPIAVTFWAIAWIVKWLDNLLLPRVLAWLLPNLETQPSLPPLVGALFTFGVILLAGVFVRHFFGHQLIRLWESVLERVPVARSIYAAVKQLFEAVFHSEETTRNFNRVVLIEYPRKGVWALAFTTGEALGALAEAVGPDHNVFVPTTPNPTSGFFLLARREDLRELRIPVEEAFKVIMSAGIVQPGAKRGAIAAVPPEVVARAAGD